MRSDYRCVYAAIWAFCAYAAAHGQATTNGTMLADDLTSQSRVVVDAWANSSNNVTAAIGNLEFRLADGTATNGIKVFNSRYSDYAIDAENAWLASTAESLNGFTNKVDETVTRRAFKGWTSWTFELNGVPTDDFRLEWNDSAYRLYRKSGSSWDTYGEGGSADTTTNITFDSSLPNWSGGSDVLVCSRESITTNVLGLATYADLKDIAPEISTNEIVSIVTNETAWYSPWLFHLTGSLGSDGWYEESAEWKVEVFPDDTQPDPYAYILSFPYGYANTQFGNEKNPTNIVFSGSDGSGSIMTIEAKRSMYPRNALGLARFSDIPTSVSQLKYDNGFTNAVSDIVTNSSLVLLSRDWVATPALPSGYAILWNDEYMGGGWVILNENTGTSVGTDGDAHNFDSVYVHFMIGAENYVATRKSIILNSLGLATYAQLTNGLASVDIPTNGFITSDYISTNNAAFVSVVTNCHVAIATSDAEALTEWGIYGGGGTIGALLAALAAAVAALKKKKMPLYPVGGSGNPVNATYESGVLTVSPFAMAAYTPTASAAFSVAMGALPSDLESGKARDAVLVIDCSSLTDGQEPTVTWDTHFHPRTDAGTDFACVAGAKNVYYISEYAQGEFAVGGWTETAGGNA